MTVPLFIAMLAVLLAVAICVVCVIISDFIAALSVLLIGGKLLLRGLVSFPYSLSGALMITGCGLLGIGCALLLYILGICLCKWMGMLLVKLAQCLARKRGKNHEKQINVYWLPLVSSVLSESFSLVSVSHPAAETT